MSRPGSALRAMASHWRLAATAPAARELGRRHGGYRNCRRRRPCDHDSLRRRDFAAALDPRPGASNGAASADVQGTMDRTTGRLYAGDRRRDVFAAGPHGHLLALDVPPACAMAPRLTAEPGAAVPAYGFAPRRSSSGIWVIADRRPERPRPARLRQDERRSGTRRTRRRWPTNGGGRGDGGVRQIVAGAGDCIRRLAG